MSLFSYSLGKIKKELTYPEPFSAAPGQAALPPGPGEQHSEPPALLTVSALAQPALSRTLPVFPHIIMLYL